MSKKQTTKQVVHLNPEQKLFLQAVVKKLDYLIEQERISNDVKSEQMLQLPNESEK